MARQAASRDPSWFLPPLLAAVSAALVFINWQLKTAPVETAAIDGPAVDTGPDEASPSSDEPNNASLQRPPNLSEALARPLFWPSRRPAVSQNEALPEPSIPVPPPPDASGMQLVGIMQADGNLKALIRPDIAAEGNWFALGDEINGWHLQSIWSDSATIENAGTTIELQLTYVNSKGRSGVSAQSGVETPK